MVRLHALLLIAPVVLGVPGFVDDRETAETAAPTVVERPMDFRFDVLPYLQREGCATAECHGGGLGRGGFKLSLFGSDPLADWQAIVVDRDGRRIDPVQTERSLLLRKPLGLVKHGGGEVLQPGSPAALAIEEWIDAGAPFIEPGMESHPLRVLRDGDHLIVRASLMMKGSEPFEEDVTDRAIFSSSNPQVVDVEPDGTLVELGSGDATLTARFADESASLRIVRGFGEQVEALPEDAPPLNRAYREGLRTLGLAPGPRADDDTLLRRLTLTLAGRIPTPEERARFYDSPAKHRLEVAAKRLLDSQEFTATATLWFREFLEIRDAAPAASDRMTARRDLSVADIVKPGVQLDEAMIGRLRGNDPLIRRFQDARDRAEWTGRAFLGTRIGCARCHDHPLDRWRRDEHLSLSAAFTDPRPGPRGPVPGQLFDPETGEVVEPDLRPWFGLNASMDAPRFNGLRSYLLEDREFGQRFAKSLANRLFGAVTGRALVDPVDDLRASNPAVLPELLDALTERLIEQEFALRPFVLELVTSEVWTRDSRPLDGDRLDRSRGEFLARATARPMSPRTRSRSIATALGVVPKQRASATDSPLARALRELSARALREALADGGSLVDAAYDFNPDDRSRVTELFLRFHGREPRPAELEALQASLAQSSEPRLHFREIACALALTRSFSSIR